MSISYRIYKQCSREWLEDFFKEIKIPCSAEKCDCCYFVKILKRGLEINGNYSYTNSVEMWEIESFSNDEITVTALE